MTDFGLDHSFATATQKIAEHYGFDIPKSSLRKYTLGNAKRIGALAQVQCEPVNALPARGVEKLVAEVDGCMIPTVYFEGSDSDTRKNRKVEYKEARLCACQSMGSTQTFYRGQIGTPESIGAQWNRCARDAGRAINTFVHVVADGATWIKQQADSALGADRFLLDFFHACEYLKDAEQSCAHNNRWFATQKNRLLRNAGALVIGSLAECLEPEHISDENAPVRCAHRYLSNRTEQIDYQNSAKEGFPIGSGLIESGHKHVIQARMKIAGAAWHTENADSMIQTRASRASGRWASAWKN